MTIKDKVGERRVIQDMHDGKGRALVYRFFEGRPDESKWFFEILFEPGAYAGYHRHEGNEEILYIVSGKAENYQDGNRCVLEAGDAILIESGQTHAIRNISDKDLQVLGFLAAPGGDIGSVENLPLPKRISDWAQ